MQIKLLLLLLKCTLIKKNDATLKNTSLKMYINTGYNLLIYRHFAIKYLVIVNTW